jgi:hypothetical protein
MIIMWDMKVFTTVAMHVANFWHKVPSSPYVNWHFGGTYHLHVQGRNLAEQEPSVQQVAT